MTKPPKGLGRGLDALLASADLPQREQPGEPPQSLPLDVIRPGKYQPRAGMDADAERARITLTRENVISVLTTIRRNYSDGLTGALGLLDEPQKPKADELLRKQSAETEEALRDKLGTGLDGMAGGRRGERPPPA